MLYHRLTNANILTIINGILGVTLALFLLWYATIGTMGRDRYSVIFLGIGLTLYFLVKIEDTLLEFPNRISNSNLSPKELINILFIIICLFSIIISTIYIEYHWERLTTYAPAAGFRTVDGVIGLLVITSVLYATLLAYGNIITITLLSFILYGIVGPWLPGIMSHPGISIGNLGIQGALEMRGVYGFILQVGATWVAVFLIFAGMAKSYGMIGWVSELGTEISRVLKTGVVQVAIVSSMVMGSITGSAAANTATTGSFTIPMMIEQKVEEEYAAAIEGVASSGGQMLPPIMGVAAFLMADLLGVSYFSIIIHAAIPALLFFIAASLSTHLIVLKHGWTSNAEGKFDVQKLWRGIYYLPPIVVLIYTLMIMRVSPLVAGRWTIFALVITGSLKVFLAQEGYLSGIIEVSIELVQALIQGSKDLAPLLGVLGSIGIGISMIQQTGTGQRISLQIISIAGGSLILVLIITMALSIILGMGMPTVAAYLLLVVLVAPSLTRVGVSDIGTHLFVLYFGMLSAITPPIAISVVIGARIANSNFIQSAIHALRIGLGGFLVPYIFIYNPSLLYWTFPETLLMTVIAIISLAGIAIAVIGYNGARNISYIERVFFISIAMVGLFGPVLIVQLIISAIIISYLIYIHTSFEREGSFYKQMGR